MLETKTLLMYVCDGCGFSWDAIHEDDTPEGGYTCMNCGSYSPDGTLLVSKARDDEEVEDCLK